jgi:hypothetical protein
MMMLLKQAGVPVTDQRDIDRRRYDRALARWHEAVLDRVRSTIRELIAKRKRAAKAQNRAFGLIDGKQNLPALTASPRITRISEFLRLSFAIATTIGQIAYPL